jgi:hypothetical protein
VKRAQQRGALLTEEGKTVAAAASGRQGPYKFDTAARRLRGEDVHGGRLGVNWLRLNFPIEGEMKRAQEAARAKAPGMP